MHSPLFVLMERASLMLMIVYLTFRFQITKRILKINPSLKRSIWIGLLGGALGILGTYLGINYKGAIINYRDTGVIVASLIGGMPAGLISAGIAATHRLFLGGITAFPCFLGTMTAGIVTGVLSHVYGRRIFNVQFATVYVIIIEMVHLAYVFFMVRPHMLAVDITETVMFTMVATNTFSVAVLVAIFSETEKDFENITATTTSAIFKIVENTIDIVDRGLAKNAEKLAKEIKNHTDFDAVAITDKKVVLAHVGAGEDHHLPNAPILTKATRDVLVRGKGRVIRKKDLIGCSKEECPLKSAVIAPIKLVNGSIIGAIKFYRTREYAISKSDVELARGLSQIISMEVSLSRALKDSQMMYEIKYRSILSKFKPHFLFNALNAISYLVKSDPFKAREMIFELSELLRYTVKEENTMIDVKREMEFVNHYLKFMKYRYDDEFEYEISNEIDENVKIPSFILQPIIENSIKHAKIPSKKLKISVKGGKKNDKILLMVKDNGKGFNPSKKSQGLGIELLKKRLYNLFGSDAKISIVSTLNKGCETQIYIPYNKDFEVMNIDENKNHGS